MVTPIFRKIKRFQTKSDALTQKVYLLAKTPLLAPKPKDNETNEEETTRLHVDLFPTFTKFIRTSPNRLAVALVLALAAVLQTPGSAFAARYILHHAGFALNTNNNFSRIDGEPRMSIYRTNYNDPDQQFEFIPVGSAVMLKHRSTGKCLNAYRPRNGGTVNVWACNPNDPEQLWDLLHKSGTIYLIRAHGTNFCIDNYNRIDEGNVHAWECNFNNPNQLWDVHDVVTGQGYVRGGSNLTLIRTGGQDVYVDLDAIGISLEILNAFGKFMGRMSSNYDHEQVILRNNYGEHVMYYAQWGTYERLTGPYIERYSRQLTNDGIFSGVGITAGGSWIGSIIGLTGAGAAIAAIVGGASVWHNTNLADDLNTCKDTTGVAYVRRHLTTGSWQKSIIIFLTTGSQYAFNTNVTVSCN